MRLILVTAMLACAALSAPARAMPPLICPVEFGEVDGAIEKASSCEAAYRILEACLLGASGDVSRAHAVREICERDFLPGLKPDTRRAYARAQRRCDRKYAGDEGTMYRSMEAVCAAQLAKGYSDRALRKR